MVRGKHKGDDNSGQASTCKSHSQKPVSLRSHTYSVKLCKQLERMTSSLTFKQGADFGKRMNRSELSVLAKYELHEDKRNAADYHHDQIWDHKCSWRQKMKGNTSEQDVKGGKECGVLFACSPWLLSCYSSCLLLTETFGGQKNRPLN